MPSTDLLTVLRSRWPTVLLCAFLGATFVLALTRLAEPQYTSTSSLYFSMRTGNSGTELNQGAAYVAASMDSFAELASSSVVLGDVRKELDLTMSTRALGRMIAPSVRKGTALLDIDVTTNDRQLSADISNSVGAATAAYALETAPKAPVALQGRALLRVERVRDAAPSSRPSAPKPARDVLAGLLAGLLVGLAVGLVQEHRDDLLRRSDELVETTGVPVPVVLPLRAGSASDGDGAWVGAHRRLRLWLDASGQAAGPLVVAAVSAPGNPVAVGVPGNAVAVARGLSAAYAETGANVVHVHSGGLGAPAGLSPGLLERTDLVLGTDKFWTLPAGAASTHGPALDSPDARAALSELSRAFDIVVISCGSVPRSADAAILARSGLRMLLVAELHVDRLPEVVRAVDDLAALGVQPLAFVPMDTPTDAGPRGDGRLRPGRVEAGLAGASAAPEHPADRLRAVVRHALRRRGR